MNPENGRQYPAQYRGAEYHCAAGAMLFIEFLICFHHVDEFLALDWIEFLGIAYIQDQGVSLTSRPYNVTVGTEEILKPFICHSSRRDNDKQRPL